MGKHDKPGPADAKDSKGGGKHESKAGSNGKAGGSSGGKGGGKK